VGAEKEEAGGEERKEAVMKLIEVKKLRSQRRSCHLLSQQSCGHRRHSKPMWPKEPGTNEAAAWLAQGSRAQVGTFSLGV
jgi:hypothetical protein